MSYFKSLERELGKNTGKWISNKVFGNTGWATPRRHIIEAERQRARKYRKRQRQRDQIKKQEETEKHLLIALNNEEVEDHKNYTNVIRHLHRKVADPIDWEETVQSEAPEAIPSPENSVPLIEEAQQFLVDKARAELEEKFKLNHFEKFILRYRGFPFYSLISKTIKQKEQAFESALHDAIEMYHEASCMELEKQKNAFSKRQTAIEKHQSLVQVARGILERDPVSYQKAIALIDPFDDLLEYGSNLTMQMDPSRATVDFFVHGEDVVPTTYKYLIRKGTGVSEKPLPKKKYFSIYQDYVCSCILRIAKDLFQILPLMEVQVNAKAMVIDPSTGHYQEVTIVSVLLNREKLDSFNFSRLDPSESMRHFPCNMNFLITKGFRPVTELE